MVCSAGRPRPRLVTRRSTAPPVEVAAAEDAVLRPALRRAAVPGGLGVVTRRVLDPLPYVPGHVVHALRGAAQGMGAHRLGPSAAPGHRRAPAVGLRLPPGVGPGEAAASRSVLPLRLGGQARAEPRRVGPGLLPAHAVDRVVGVVPGRPVAADRVAGQRAGARRDARRVLGHRDLGEGDAEVADLHVVHRSLVRLVVGGAHREGAARQRYHHRAVAGVLVDEPVAVVVHAVAGGVARARPRSRLAGVDLHPGLAGGRAVRGAPPRAAGRVPWHVRLVGVPVAVVVPTVADLDGVGVHLGVVVVAVGRPGAAGEVAVPVAVGARGLRPVGPRPRVAFRGRSVRAEVGGDRILVGGVPDPGIEAERAVDQPGAAPVHLVAVARADQERAARQQEGRAPHPPSGSSADRAAPSAPAASARGPGSQHRSHPSPWTPAKGATSCGAGTRCGILRR